MSDLTPAMEHIVSRLEKKDGVYIEAIYDGEGLASVFLAGYPFTHSLERVHKSTFKGLVDRGVIRPCGASASMVKYGLSDDRAD